MTKIKVGDVVYVNEDIFLSTIRHIDTHFLVVTWEDHVVLRQGEKRYVKEANKGRHYEKY